MADDLERLAHQEWLGYVQPVGLVVSAPALLAAQAILNRNIGPEHRRFVDRVEAVRVAADPDRVPVIADLPGLLQDVFGWQAGDLVGSAGAAPLPADLEVVLPEYEETLRPTFAVPEVEPGDGGSPWLMLIQVVSEAVDLDTSTTGGEGGWQANPQARFERLLRGTRVPIGLLCSLTHLRLVYAPVGESSGYLTFPVAAMAQVAGRPLFAALHLLLSQDRLFSLPRRQRLPALLADSRRYQNEVSTRLSGQVLAALYELLRGFQAADEQAHGELLARVLREDPDSVYAGLLTVLLRLVFILYAEDRGLLPQEPVYVNHYAVIALFERLRADAGRFPDTMDQRYGAWAQLLSVFRLFHDGARHGSLQLPPRHGYLFNPDRFSFLEGRPYQIHRVMGEGIQPPRVADGVVFRVLQALLLLEGERISYRALDVEQIGSVYEAMMGFHLEVAAGRAIAVKSTRPHGAPVAVNLDEMLDQPAERRASWLRERTDQTLTGEALAALKAARTAEQAVSALGRKVASDITPTIAPAGSMLLQPSDERRRSGAHYTPRSLTEPIVTTTLRPVLAGLGERPTPARILGLKVCDPAMGSGAFLVEACRQLGSALVGAWHAHGAVPRIPPDEDEELHARRLVAQQCLYGVDKNPLAVDLAKLSLWLATLARDHAFTFLDHALRHGDSLVGLTRQQLAAFHWEAGHQMELFERLVASRVAQAADLRQRLQHAGEEEGEGTLRALLVEADDALEDVRLLGDLVVVAYFGGESAREREARRSSLVQQAQSLASGRPDPALREQVRELREQARPVAPFHWEAEFAEVFGRANPGFDAMVGNPPFAGKNTTANSNAPAFTDWLKTLHAESHGNSDLVAHFFRRAFGLLRQQGAFGLIATNTIGQGDTRATGLRWICTHGGTIFSARRRVKWPGQAAVVVSVVHVHKGDWQGTCELDGRSVPQVTAYLFHAGGHDNPATLRANAGKSFQGSIVLGMGFTFDDTDAKGVASSLAEMQRLIAANPRNAERIFPYIGGEEVNTSPTQTHHRYVINFGEMSADEARQWPDLMRIVEERVRPERMRQNREVRRRYWWRYGETTPALRAAIEGMERVLVISRVGQHCLFSFLPTGVVCSESLVVVARSTSAALCALQCRPHEVWARFFASSMKDDLRYTPTDCFETFPFPEHYDTDRTLKQAGATYYDHRASLMVAHNEGLTKTYNRFHDPEECSPAILQLRDLHAAMDRAVLDAYGWHDLQPTCEFLLDYDDEADEDDEPSTAGRTRRRPWRYRWPDSVRDEVLARLLALNHERASAEQLSSAAADSPKPPRRPAAKRGRTAMPDRGPSAGDLFRPLI